MQEKLCIVIHLKNEVVTVYLKNLYSKYMKQFFLCYKGIQIPDYYAILVIKLIFSNYIMAFKFNIYVCTSFFNYLSYRKRRNNTTVSCFIF